MLVTDFYKQVKTYRTAPPLSYESWLYYAVMTRIGGMELVETIARICYEKSLDDEETCVLHEYALFTDTSCLCSNCRYY